MLNLVPANQRQTSLFDNRDRERSERLMSTIYQINHQFGAGTIRFAATGLEQPWKLKAAHRSARYTTCWEDVPLAAAAR